jgi:hypothetical protein
MCYSNFPAKFVINANTGIVTVFGDLDAENRSQYRIIVRAREDLGTFTTPDEVSLGNTDWTALHKLGCDMLARYVECN